MSIKATLIILILICAPWFINAYKFASCDFKSDYRCEAIHVIGVVVPPASFVTAWFDSDEK